MSLVSCVVGRRGQLGWRELAEMALRGRIGHRGLYLLERIRFGLSFGWDERWFIRLLVRLVPCARGSLCGDGNYRGALTLVTRHAGGFVSCVRLFHFSHKSITSFCSAPLLSVCGCTYVYRCAPPMICVIRAVYFQDRPSGRFRCWQVKPGVPVHEE